MVVANDPRALTSARVEVFAYDPPIGQLVPFARHTSWPATKSCEVEAVPTTTKLPVVVTLPWRFTENTVFARSFTPRIKKSLELFVPDERTSSALRVPVAEVLEV